MDGLLSRLDELHTKLEWMGGGGYFHPPQGEKKHMEPENYQVMKRKIYVVSHLFEFISIYHLYLDDDSDCIM